MQREECRPISETWIGHLIQPSIFSDIGSFLAFEDGLHRYRLHFLRQVDRDHAESNVAQDFEWATVPVPDMQFGEVIFVARCLHQPSLIVLGQPNL